MDFFFVPPGTVGGTKFVDKHIAVKDFRRVLKYFRQASLGSVHTAFNYSLAKTRYGSEIEAIDKFVSHEDTLKNTEWVRGVDETAANLLETWPQVHWDDLKSIVEVTKPIMQRMSISQTAGPTGFMTVTDSAAAVTAYSSDFLPSLGMNSRLGDIKGRFREALDKYLIKNIKCLDYAALKIHPLSKLITPEPFGAPFSEKDGWDLIGKMVKHEMHKTTTKSTGVETSANLDTDEENSQCSVEGGFVEENLICTRASVELNTYRSLCRRLYKEVKPEGSISAAVNKGLLPASCLRGAFRDINYLVKQENKWRMNSLCVFAEGLRNAVNPLKLCIYVCSNCDESLSHVLKCARRLLVHPESNAETERAFSWLSSLSKTACPKDMDYLESRLLVKSDIIFKRRGF